MSVGFNTLSGNYRGAPVTLPAPAVGDLPNARGQLVASWQGPAQPIEVALENLVNPPTTGTLFYGMNLPSKVGGVGPLGVIQPRRAGWFKLEYGMGGVVRTRYVDLDSARVYLGACDSVTISAHRWLTNNLIWAPDSTVRLVSATIGPATGGNYDELTSTVELYADFGNPIYQRFWAPIGAYACASYVSNLQDADPLWGSAQPVIEFHSETETWAYDFANFAIAPATRRYVANSNLFAVTTHGANIAADVIVGVKFYLNS